MTQEPATDMGRRHMAVNDFPRITTSKFPVAEVTSVAPVIGDPQAYKEITRAIRAHGNSQKSIS